MQSTLLKEEQIWGDNALSIMDIYGRSAGLSDLAVLLGGMLSSFATTSDGLRTGYLWSASSNEGRNVRIVGDDGVKFNNNPYRRDGGARPALPPSITSPIRASEASAKITLRNGQKAEVRQLGTYPQTIASDKISEVLELSFKTKNLPVSGNKYTFDSEPLDAYKKPFKPQEYAEYIYDDRRYIRVIGVRCDSDSILSNGKSVKNGEPYWVEVQPINWLVDKSGWWVSHVCLFSGVKYMDGENYDGDFSKTNMKQYLDNYFSKQIMQARVANKSTEKFSNAQQKVGFGLTIIDEPMPVREQIDFYIKSGKSFMLHGPSGVGKTARVEAIDPDLTAVPLWNGVLPEDIVGKVRYPSGATAPLATSRADGEMPDDFNESHGVWVPPDWYNELIRKCNAQPDKQHVLFIDEVTNAKPTTQSLIFHIVLKKSISPSKGKLPANAVVVLAGNDKMESGAAYNMPAPLFRRMSGHIYLQANLPEWLEWASERSRKHPKDANRLNVHPLVSQFLSAHQENFYSQYDEDEPKEWAVDPRGWEQVSDIIYDNGGVIRRELIENKIGRENAATLLEFAREPMLSPEDVINGNYTVHDIPKGQTQRLATALGLRHTNERQIKKVREFIDQHLGAENLAIFDSKWAEGNPERAIQIGQMTKFCVSVPTPTKKVR